MSELVLGELEKSLEEAIDNLWQCSVIADDFSDPSMQEEFNSKLSGFVENLKQLDSLAREVDVDIPMQVIQSIDKGVNPEVISKEYYDLCKSQNDQARGRIFATDVFHGLLSERMSHWDDYRMEQTGSAPTRE